MSQTTDQFGHAVPHAESTITLEDPETGEPTDLPLFRECCDDQRPVAVETEMGLMDMCDNCGNFI